MTTSQAKPDTMSASPFEERRDQTLEPIARRPDVGIGEYDHLVVGGHLRERRAQIGDLLTFVLREPGDDQRHAIGQFGAPAFNRRDGRIVGRFDREDDAKERIILRETDVRENDRTLRGDL